MPDNIVTLDFPADPATWPAAFVAFQISQVAAVSPELAPVTTPSSPTIQAAVPVEFTSAGNQVAGPFRTVW